VRLPFWFCRAQQRWADASGKDANRSRRQAKIYKEMFEVCLESGVCKSFSVWGIGDKFHFLKDPRYRGSSPNADPTPFDDDLNPKPAYFALLDVLR
jgi:endo-1,4-beta-xylanase